jgi:hypothetical protein
MGNCRCQAASCIADPYCTLLYLPQDLFQPSLLYRHFLIAIAFFLSLLQAFLTMFSLERRSLFGNGTCPLPSNEKDLELVGKPIVGSLTFQHLLLIISIACAGTTVVLSLWLILKHLHRYTQPKQQRHIIRVIFLPPAFAALSVWSILDYKASMYIIPLRDIYETFALASLFILFIEYVSPDKDTRDAYFYNLERRKKRGGPFSRSKEYDVIPGGSLMWFRVCKT